jgi:hypothetical protein
VPNKINEFVVLTKTPIDQIYRRIKDSDILAFDYDDTGHGLDKLLSYGIGTYGVVLPNMIANILTNGMNNSVYNARGDNFVPISSAQELMMPPKNIMFARDKPDLYSCPEKLSEATGYVDRVTKILSSIGRG